MTEAGNGKEREGPREREGSRRKEGRGRDMEVREEKGVGE